MAEYHAILAKNNELLQLAEMNEFVYCVCVDTNMHF